MFYLSLFVLIFANILTLSFILLNFLLLLKIFLLLMTFLFSEFFIISCYCFKVKYIPWVPKNINDSLSYHFLSASTLTLFLLSSFHLVLMFNFHMRGFLHISSGPWLYSHILSGIPFQLVGFIAFLKQKCKKNVDFFFSLFSQPNSSERNLPVSAYLI